MFNETDYISASAIDYDANGDIAVTNDTILAAPGAGYRIVLYGVSMPLATNSASAAVRGYLTNGTKASDTIVWQARSQGATPTQTDMSFNPGLKLSANTALNFTGEEDTAQGFCFGTVYYRIERT